MRLRREVDDDVDVLEQRLDEVEVADVAVCELDPVGDVGEARPVARVGQQVEDDDLVVGVPATRERA